MLGHGAQAAEHGSWIAGLGAQAGGAVSYIAGLEVGMGGGLATSWFLSRPGSLLPASSAYTSVLGGACSFPTYMGTSSA